MSTAVFLTPSYAMEGSRRTYYKGRIPDKGEVGGSSPPRPTINQPQCLCGHSRFCLSPEFPAKPLSRICQLPESPYAVPDVTGNTMTWRGVHGLLEFLADGHCSTALKERKNINVHSRHIGLWKSSLQNQRSQIRGVTVIDTCVIWTIARLIRDGSPAGNRRCWSSSGNGAPLTKT
jgi:hypothetical protein